ncbi:hypothetical protein, partial [uncultured Akkermansia sp.]|uniref:hypothetical protein n=1 Tax=uncultured Akkermansia sp. TaxID=512294 RepID=UPI0025D12E08
ADASTLFPSDGSHLKRCDKEVKNGLKGFLSGNPSPFPTALFFQHSAIIDSRRLPFPGTRRLFICGPPQIVTIS